MSNACMKLSRMIGRNPFKKNKRKYSLINLRKVAHLRLLMMSYRNFLLKRCGVRSKKIDCCILHLLIIRSLMFLLIKMLKLFMKKSAKIIALNLQIGSKQLQMVIIKSEASTSISLLGLR